MRIDLNPGMHNALPLQQIQARDQLVFISQYSSVYLWANLIGSTLLVALVLAEQADKLILAAVWYIAIMLINGMRWLLEIGFKPSQRYTSDQSEKLLQQQLLYITLINSLWGASGLILFFDAITLQTIHALLLGILAISSLPILTLIRPYMYLQIAVLVTPLILHLSVVGEIQQSVLAFMVLMMGVVLGMVSRIFEILANKLTYSQAQLQEQSNRDPVTMIPNKRHFEQAFKAEWQRASRTGSPIALLMIDLDSFRQYNDARDYHQGDEVLKRIAMELRQVARRHTDTVVRYGSDSFAVLLPGLEMNAASILAENIRQSIENLNFDFSYKNKQQRITASIGVSYCFPASQERDEGSTLIYPAILLNAVDRALYRAKRDGRNQVVEEYCGDETISKAVRHVDELRAAQVA